MINLQKMTAMAALMLSITMTGAALAEATPSEPLSIAEQGMFSAGGTVTEPVAGDYDPTTNWLDTTRAGNTAHVDHANVLYQIPTNDNGHPMVYLHGYGQSRMGDLLPAQRPQRVSGRSAGARRGRRTGEHVRRRLPGYMVGGIQGL